MDEFSPDQRTAPKFTRVRVLVQGVACAAFLALSCGAAYADSLKNSDFLKYSEGQRHWWYSGAYTVLGHVAFLEDEEKGKCVWNWLAADYENKEALLMKSFRMYPDHTPSGVVIALLRRDCGVFQKKQ